MKKEKAISILAEKLKGEDLKRVKRIINLYHERLVYDVINVVFYAIDQGKSQEIFSELERHYREVLKYQHPNIMGKTVKTQDFFIGLCKNNLGL